MPDAIVTFRQCLIDSHTVGFFDATPDQFVSRVVFDLEIGDMLYLGQFVELRQKRGMNYLEDPFEIGTPSGVHPYLGPYSAMTFEFALEDYYRSQVGPGGSGFNVGEGSSLIGCVSIGDSEPKVIPLLTEAIGGWHLDSPTPWSPTPEFPLEGGLKIVQGDFENSTLPLDGHYYRGCRFVRCKLTFAGGKTQLGPNNFTHTTFHLIGPALDTINLFRVLHRSPYSFWVSSVIEYISGQPSH